MNHLMAGLVVTTACFSLSLAIASAHKNVSFNNAMFSIWPSLPEQATETILLISIAVGVVLAVRWLLQSEIGLLLRATGDNADLLAHFGKSQYLYYFLGFAVANALTSIAGSLFVQWSQFFSITGNIGTLVTGLASLMIAELFTKKLSMWIIFSSIAYQSIFALTLMSGLAPVWNNLVKAGIMVTLVMLSSKLAKGRLRSRHA
jgi:putative ABC transport system permease protein